MASKTKKHIEHRFHGLTIYQRAEDGYINATALAKTYAQDTGIRKDVAHWLVTTEANEYLKFVLLETGIPVSKLVQIRRGQPAKLQGTYLHPDLAVPFAEWLSVRFRYAATKCVQQWMVWLAQQETPRQTIDSEMVKLFLTDAPVKWDTSPFVIEFYEHLYRIWGGKLGQLDPLSNKRPGCVGMLTNKTVYDRAFPEEVSSSLHVVYKNSTARKYELLSEKVGQPKLSNFFEMLLPFMRISPPDSPGIFLRLINRAFPPKVLQLELFNVILEIERVAV